MVGLAVAGMTDDDCRRTTSQTDGSCNGSSGLEDGWDYEDFLSIPLNAALTCGGKRGKTSQTELEEDASAVS